jgi:2-oxo-4-hydroxy-4-carboxy-5-ureidoimidazoline decarboxylase
MRDVLTSWNRLPVEEAVKEILPCCGSKVWAHRVAARRPFPDEATLLAASDETWRTLAKADWMEAFRSHPRIGESGPSPSSPPQSLSWSKQEQQNVTDAGNSVKIALAEANREYEQRFQQIFIVCASDKSGLEILEILRRRQQNSEETELQEAAEQQRQITQMRLKKWLSR